MITFEDARKIGIKTCIEALGVDFVKKHADTASSAFGYGEDEQTVFCFVGVDDEPQRPYDGVLILTSKDSFPYRASCNVSMYDGTTKFIERVTP